MSTEQKPPISNSSLSLWLAGFVLAVFVTSGTSFVTSEPSVQIAAASEEATEDRNGGATALSAPQNVSGSPQRQTIEKDVTSLADINGNDGEARDAEQGRDEDRSLPETFQQAVTAVVHIDGTIRDALARNNHEAGHRALHEFGDILNEINGLASRANLNGAQRMSVQIAVAKLFELYSAVDAPLHGREGLSYDQVSLEIEENLQRLKDACPPFQGGTVADVDGVRF